MWPFIDESLLGGLEEIAKNNWHKFQENVIQKIITTSESDTIGFGFQLFKHGSCELCGNVLLICQTNV